MCVCTCICNDCITRMFVCTRITATKGHYLAGLRDVSTHWRNTGGHTSQVCMRYIA